MRLRTLGLAAAIAAALAQLAPEATAVVGRKGMDPAYVAAGRAPRTHREVRWSHGAGASLPGWSAVWDRDTEVPMRVWGKGPSAPGAVADAAIAETAARQFLAQHLATLAPGASISDFVVVGNALSRRGDVRSVGFEQRAGGIRVVGGAVGVTFKADRIVLVSSTALPHVRVAPPASRLAATTIQQRAIDWLASAGHAVKPTATHTLVAPERVIVPIVRPRIGATPDITYQVAEPVVVEAVKGAGRWTVWVDAHDARPIARKSDVHWASGKVQLDVADRYPGSTRTAQPAAFANHAVNNVATLSTADGTVTWTGTTNATVRLGLTGSIVAMTNGQGPLAALQGTLAPNGKLTFSQASAEFVDAQLTSYAHAVIAKRFAKTRLDPNLAWLDGALSVTVNEDGSCNAYSTGDDIHFFPADGQCENTGRMADVVYHEFGHSLHHNAIIPGVGNFDGAMSEGMSDVLASLLTGDSGMGRGFFFSNEPLRELDPVGREKRYPDDVSGQVHDDGEIIGGTLWDLRVALEAKLGAEAGFEKTLDIFYGILQRAGDMTTAYAEALTADDDDGDLTNGTPNQCDIASVFGRHGLADPTVTGGFAPPTREGYNISVQATSTGGNAACPGPSVASAQLEWRPRGGAGGSLPLVQSGDRFSVELPLQPDGTVVQYKVTLTMTDGSSLSYPNNLADPFYELYVGEVQELWCSRFENGLEGWVPGGLPSSANEWEVGMPLGLGGDPKAAFSGANVLGLDLSTDGIYAADGRAFIDSPEIDLQGHTAVRLQYRRWLGAEDSRYDKATIKANGRTVWTNKQSATNDMDPGVAHRDREWRFHDIDLSSDSATGKLKLRFDVETDSYVEFGGWTVDDVCVVALAGAALTCGNGTVDDGEECDDGNRADGDGCNANCESGDGLGMEPTPADGGCCSTGTHPAGPLGLAALIGGLVLRRRRRS